MAEIVGMAEAMRLNIAEQPTLLHPLPSCTPQRPQARPVAVQLITRKKKLKERAPVQGVPSPSASTSETDHQRWPPGPVTRSTVRWASPPVVGWR